RLNKYANPTDVGSLFTNLSANGRVIVPPYLDVIARALLVPTVREKIETWAHDYWKDKHPNAMERQIQLNARLLYLEDSLKAAESARQVETSAAGFVERFEQAFAVQDQTKHSEAHLTLQELFKNASNQDQEVIALLAKKLSSIRRPDTGHRRLSEAL